MNQPISNDYSLLVLSSPTFAEADLTLIQGIRERLDPDTANLIPPHFTHLLPVDSSWERTVEISAKEIAKQIDPIKFEVKTLTILDNPETGEQFLVLILKDYEPLLNLHKTVYDHMGMPTPFGDDWIPHLTLGVSQDRQMLIDEAKVLKKAVVGIPGVVDSIEIIKWKTGEIETISKLPLGKA